MWRETVTTTQPVPQSPVEGTKRRVSQQDKVGRIKTLILQYDDVLDKKEYLRMMAALLD